MLAPILCKSRLLDTALHDISGRPTQSTETTARYFTLGELEHTTVYSGVHWLSRIVRTDSTRAVPVRQSSHECGHTPKHEDICL